MQPQTQSYKMLMNLVSSFSPKLDRLFVLNIYPRNLEWSSLQNSVQFLIQNLFVGLVLWLEIFEIFYDWGDCQKFR